MTYEKFASVYDELMKDVPYDKWVEIVNNQKDKLGIEGKKLLDLACGTGELSIRFADSGFEVTGVDLSADMLSIANKKAQSTGHNINFLQQNMTELDLMGDYDIIGIFCDSLNYLSTVEEVRNTFEGVFRYLKKGGLFVFDVHSVFKIEEIFMDQSFTYDQDDICYIWNCFPGDWPLSVDHELTFFVQDQSGKYERFDENHTQRTFTVDAYENMLAEAGFECLEVLADFEAAPPTVQSERLFFIAKKK